MASIPTAQAFSGTTPPAAATGSGPGAAAQADGDNSTDGFTQLLAELMGTETSAPPTDGQLSLQDFAALALGSGEIDPQTDTGDTDEDTDCDEAGALAVAALLPGLCLAPAAPAAAGAGGAANASGIEDSIAIVSAKVAMDLSSAADQLADGAADAAGNTRAPDSTTSSGAPNTTTSAQMHAMLAAHTPPDAEAVPDGMLRSPVGTHQWKDELGTQLTWMAVNGREAASLRLSPEHLGPLDIRISVRDGEASVWFGATNPDTRSALEQSLPRLRELFASQGLVLADAGVSRDPSRNLFRPPAFAPGMRGSSDAGAEQSVTSITLARAGLIDTYV